MTAREYRRIARAIRTHEAVKFALAATIVTAMIIVMLAAYVAQAASTADGLFFLVLIAATYLGAIYFLKCCLDWLFP